MELNERMLKALSKDEIRWVREQGEEYFNEKWVEHMAKAQTTDMDFTTLVIRTAKRYAHGTNRRYA